MERPISNRLLAGGVADSGAIAWNEMVKVVCTVVSICTSFDVATYGETRCAFGKVGDGCGTHGFPNQRASSAIAGAWIIRVAVFACSVARLACSDENHCQRAKNAIPESKTGSLVVLHSRILEIRISESRGSQTGRGRCDNDAGSRNICCALVSIVRNVRGDDETV